MNQPLFENRCLGLPLDNELASMRVSHARIALSSFPGWMKTGPVRFHEGNGEY